MNVNYGVRGSHWKSKYFGIGKPSGWWSMDITRCIKYHRMVLNANSDAGVNAVGALHT